MEFDDGSRQRRAIRSCLDHAVNGTFSLRACGDRGTKNDHDRQRHCREKLPHIRLFEFLCLLNRHPTVTRRAGGDMPMPPDFAKGYTSIYELQGDTPGKG